MLERPTDTDFTRALAAHRDGLVNIDMMRDAPDNPVYDAASLALDDLLDALVEVRCTWNEFREKCAYLLELAGRGLGCEPLKRAIEAYEEKEEADAVARHLARKQLQPA